MGLALAYMCDVEQIWCMGGISKRV